MRILVLSVLALSFVPSPASAQFVYPDPLYVVFEFRGDLDDPVLAGDGLVLYGQSP